MLESLLQNATKVYYKMRQVFYCKMQEFHWKMWQLLKNATFIIKLFGPENNVSDLNSNETFLKSSYFRILLNFWLTKWRPLFSQNKAIASKAWRYNYCTGRNLGFWILENGFQILEGWQRLIQQYSQMWLFNFLKICKWQIETISWENRVKIWKLLKLKCFPWEPL